jgi:PRTRC genetic system protein C
MSIEVTPIVRTFTYNGILLPDVPGLAPREVRDLYSAQYPELVSAEVEAGEVANGRQDFVFRKAVGTKGAGTHDAVHGRHRPARASRRCWRSVQATERGNAGCDGQAVTRLVAAQRAEPVRRRGASFAHRTLEEQRHAASVHRASATSDMLSPLP